MTIENYKKQFPGKALFPVIHAHSRKHALEQAVIAKDNGAHGVFVISHGDLTPYGLIDAAHDIKEKTNQWVGINFLGVHPTSAVELCKKSKIDGLWTDNAGIDDTAAIDSQPSYVTDTAELAKTWDGLYFGGTAFKYQRQPKDLQLATQIAARYMDVICTSGPGTGKAAEVMKIKQMHEALIDTANTAPIAIASGITPDNVDAYLPYSDAYLVATGISDTFYELNREKVRRLADKIRGFK